MGSNFIIFGDKRIKLSVIKKYEPSNAGGRISVKIFYTVGSKPQSEMIYFEDEEIRQDALERLDAEFNVA